MTRRILIVEDEPLIAMSMVSMLKRLHYAAVGPAHDLEQAFALLDQGEEIDAALLDLNLSSARSDSVADRLADQGIPFAFVSGYTDFQLPAKFRDRLFVSKPLTQRSLAKTLKILESEHADPAER